MRFNQSQGDAAHNWINNVNERTLANIIWKYGEERYSRKIAREIIKERSNNPIISTVQLANIVEKTLPKTNSKKHKATKTFQAIRIHINRELDVLKEALFSSYHILAPHGRLVLITYHSLEDKVIKDFIKHTDKKYTTPKNLPIREEFLTKMFKVVDKFIKPSRDEVDENIRSRSAKLSILERVDENNI